MSAVKVEIIKMDSGFAVIKVDEKICGSLEDPKSEVESVVKRIIKYLDIDNVEIIVTKG